MSPSTDAAADPSGLEQVAVGGRAYSLSDYRGINAIVGYRNNNGVARAKRLIVRSVVQQVRSRYRYHLAIEVLFPNVKHLRLVVNHAVDSPDKIEVGSDDRVRRSVIGVARKDHRCNHGCILGSAELYIVAIGKRRRSGIYVYRVSLAAV